MRANFFATARAALALAAGVVLSQCYAPTYSDCAFRCGPAAPMCPEQYECRVDGYCHLPASMVICAVAHDLGVALDLATAAASAVDAGTD